MKLEYNTILMTGGTSGFGFEFTSKLIAMDNAVIKKPKKAINHRPDY